MLYKRQATNNVFEQSGMHAMQTRSCSTQYVTATVHCNRCYNYHYNEESITIEALVL
jgi:hypothetical protein